MSFESAGYQLLPVLPEIVLAVGAMGLLMIGAFRGQGNTGLVTGLAIGLLILVGVLELTLPAGKLVTFGGSFIVDDFARFLKILAIIGSAVTLIGTFKVSIPTAFFATTGVILSAAYALWLYRKVVFGTLVKPSLASVKDLTFREGLILFPLVALTILFGVYPKPVLDMSAASVQQLVKNYDTAVTAMKAAALVQ